MSINPFDIEESHGKFFGKWASYDKKADAEPKEYADNKKGEYKKEIGPLKN